MNSKILIIYENSILYEILTEIEEFLNFQILNANKTNISKLKFNINDNYLFVSSKKSDEVVNCIIIDSKPIKIKKFVEFININFLKNKYANQSEIKIGKYKLNMNSREISNEHKKLSLTEREAEVILYIKSKKNVTIQELQNVVWSYVSDLETHTVETHIYRLRKKMNDIFKDENFIISEKNGYSIN